MRLALLGEDPRLARWGEQAAQLGASIVEGAVAESADGRRQDRMFDAVIAGGGSPGTLDAVHAWASVAPVLVIPDARQAATLAYRLVLQVEEGARIIPGFTQRLHPAVREVLRRFAAGELGDLKLVRMNRVVPSAKGRLDHATIERWLFEDLDLLRRLAGEFRRVTAVYVGTEENSSLQATVTLGGDCPGGAVWGLSPGTADAAGWELEFLGEYGSARLRQAEGPVTLAISGREAPVTDEDPVVACVREFIASQNASDGKAAQDSGTATWEDYVRAYDLLEATQRSVRRRRTIDLHFESTSERSQFKTQMTTIGCAVLMWSMFGTFAGLAAGKLLDPRSPVERRAALENAILTESDFSPDVALTKEASGRIRSAIDANSLILIEAAKGPEAEQRNADHRGAVLILASLMEGDKTPQIVIESLAGRWFVNVMRWIWIAAYAPLALFLGVQLLLPLARARKSANHDSSVRSTPDQGPS